MTCPPAGEPKLVPGLSLTCAVGRKTLALSLVTRIIEFPNLDGAFIETVEQARIDAHLAEVFPKRLPVCSAAADRAVVNANHSIAPDIGRGLA